MLVPLKVWAEAKYGEHAPHIKTLLRWARESKIVPRPKKNGRAYYVSDRARYIDYKDPDYANAIAEAIDEPTETHRG